jgi:hypothetical protein
MLSPHEFAALLILDSQEPHELNPHDLHALVKRQLVRLEQLTHNRHRLHLTAQGRHILEAIGKRHWPVR